jgi:hypothetical protein
MTGAVVFVWVSSVLLASIAAWAAADATGIARLLAAGAVAALVGMAVHSTRAIRGGRGM